MHNVTIGADPELFLIDPNGKFISSIGKIGGSKSKPRDIGHGCAVQEDNVAVEFNIAPAKDVDSFVNSINYALEYLTGHAAEKGLLLSVTASKSFDDDQLQHIRAKQFGCETDYNAWTNTPNPSPTCANPNLRSCGGHVHFGSELDKIQLARWCDVKLGLVSVLEDPDTERRSLYGKAGCFRPKPYGIEYRTLSNYWIKDTKSMKTVYQRALEVVDRVQMGWELDAEEGIAIQKAINTSDQHLAAELIAQYG